MTHLIFKILTSNTRQATEPFNTCEVSVFDPEKKLADRETCAGTKFSLRPDTESFYPVLQDAWSGSRIWENASEPGLTVLCALHIERSQDHAECRHVAILASGQVFHPPTPWRPHLSMSSNE